MRFITYCLNSLIHAYRHYADFYGTDSRRRFWGYICMSMIIGLLLILPCFLIIVNLIYSIITNPDGAAQIATRHSLNTLIQPLLQQGFTVIIFGGLWSIWGLVNMIPLASATARRLRDAGQSPWWVLAPVCCFTPINIVIPSVLSGIAALLCLVTLILCCHATAPGGTGNSSHTEQS